MLPTISPAWPCCCNLWEGQLYPLSVSGTKVAHKMELMGLPTCGPDLSLVTAVLVPPLDPQW